MEQYLVAIKDTEKTFYWLCDDAEALDSIFSAYGGWWEEGCNYGIVGCWKMTAPEFEEKLGTNKPLGLYPGCEIIQKGEQRAAD